MNYFFLRIMFQRIFSRASASHYIIISILVSLFVIYEIKLWYVKYQKGKRLAYYNSYVDEVEKLANKIEWSYNKTSIYTRQLSRLLQISLKKEGSN